MSYATVHTLDPHTTGFITRNDQNLEEIPFDFYSEDQTEWERLADETLEASGWVRTGPWNQNVAPIAPTTIWIASGTLRNENDTLAIITDAMDGYERREYTPTIQAGKLNEVAREEWANVWLQGDDVFYTEEAARAHADAEWERGTHRKIVEITLHAVTVALQRAFGDE